MGLQYSSASPYSNNITYSLSHPTASLGMKARIIAPALSYNDVSLTYNNVNTTYNAPGSTQANTRPYLTVQARIAQQHTFGLLLQARLSFPTLRSTQIKARMIAPLPSVYTFTAKASIHHHGEITARAFLLAHPTQTLKITSVISNKGRQSITMSGRVFHGSLLRFRAVIRNTPYYAVTMKASMGPPRATSWTLSAKAKMALRQGWPIPSPSSGNFNTFTDTRLRFRATIKGATKTRRGLTMAAKLRWVRLPSFSSRAFMVKGATLSLGAFISPDRRRVAVSASYEVIATLQNKVRAVFYIQGNLVSPSMSMGAAISQAKKKRVTAHFIVTQPKTTKGIQIITTAVRSSGPQQTLGIKARITK